MMRSAMERGKWVFFQNCHLAPSFMPALERLIEQIDPDKVFKMQELCGLRIEFFSATLLRYITVLTMDVVT